MKQWKISDFVFIGLLSAVYGAIALGIGMLTATLNPILHMISSAIIALIMGTIVLFVVYKVNKVGAFTLFFGVSTVAFSGFSGMFYFPLVAVVTGTAFIVDLVISKLKYKTPFVAIGYGVVLASYIFGGCIPVLFFLEQNIKHWQEAGMDSATIEEFVRLSTGWFLVGSMFACFVAGIIGVYIGKIILKRHFKEIE